MDANAISTPCAIWPLRLVLTNQGVKFLRDLPYQVFDDTRLTVVTSPPSLTLPPAQVRTAQRRPTWLRSLPIHRLHAWSACSERHLHRTRGINGLAAGHLAVGKEHIFQPSRANPAFTFLLPFTRT